MKWDRGLPYVDSEHWFLPIRYTRGAYRQLGKADDIPSRYHYGVNGAGAYYFWKSWLAVVTLLRKLWWSVVLCAWRVDLARPGEVTAGVCWRWKKAFGGNEKWGSWPNRYSRGYSFLVFLKRVWTMGW